MLPLSRWFFGMSAWVFLGTCTWGDDSATPPPPAPIPETAPLPPAAVSPVPPVSPQPVPPPGAAYRTPTVAPAVPLGTIGAGPAAGTGPFWAPGGYEARIGSPYLYHDPQGGQFVNTGNPYYDHYGPGFQRHSLHGHYRFPYYNYRAPWYYPGRAVYNRDTNFPW